MDSVMWHSSMAVVRFFRRFFDREWVRAASVSQLGWRLIRNSSPATADLLKLQELLRSHHRIS